MDQSPFFPLPFYQDESNRVYVAPRLKIDQTSNLTGLSNTHQLADMLAKLFGEPIKLVYDDFGKPWLEPQLAFLSVSHSDDLLSIALSTSHACGIDIELRRDSLEKIVTRLLHPSEQAILETVSDRQMALQYMWGAKEAVYKSWGKRGLQFATDMVLEPFETTGNDKLTLQFQHKGLKRIYSLQASYFPGNYLVFTQSVIHQH